MTQPNLSYYLPIDGERIIGFIPFPKVLVLCEMQSVSSRIWTRVAVSNSCDKFRMMIFIEESISHKATLIIQIKKTFRYFLVIY